MAYHHPKSKLSKLKIVKLLILVQLHSNPKRKAQLGKSLDEFAYLRRADHRWDTSVAHGSVFLNTISEDLVTEKKNSEAAQHSATTSFCSAK